MLKMRFAYLAQFQTSLSTGNSWRHLIIEVPPNFDHGGDSQWMTSVKASVSESKAPMI